MDEFNNYFFEAYFHQDWREDFSSSLEAVKAFKLNEDQINQKILLSDLKKLRHSNYASQDIINILGGNFRPETEGFSIDDWIRKAIEILQDNNN